MPLEPLFDIAVVMARLQDVIELERRRTPADFAEALPELSLLPRYRGPTGADLLYKELKEALAALPDDPKLTIQDSTWGLAILGFDHPTESIGMRRGGLRESNGSARKYRDRCVIQAALHQLELRALDLLPPSRGLFDSGFDVLKISTVLSTTASAPMAIRHTVHLRLRARRSGQRLVPICYSGGHTFDSVVAHGTRDSPRVDVTYAGCSVPATGNPELPLHLFWLSPAPLPYAKIYMKAIFYEHRAELWHEARSRLLLVTDGAPQVVMRAAFSEWFERVRGYRHASGEMSARPEFDSGPEGERRRKLEYWPTDPEPQTGYELRCIASERHLDKQHQYVRQ